MCIVMVIIFVDALLVFNYSSVAYIEYNALLLNTINNEVQVFTLLQYFDIF